MHMCLSTLIFNTISIQYCCNKWSASYFITHRNEVNSMTTAAYVSVLLIYSVSITCVYMCVCVCVCVCVCMHTCVCICVCLYVYMCVCVCLYVYMCMCVFVCIHVCVCVFVCVNVCHTCVCLCVHMQLLAHMMILVIDHRVCALLLTATKESTMPELLFWWSLWITNVCHEVRKLAFYITSLLYTQTN